MRKSTALGTAAAFFLTLAACGDEPAREVDASNPASDALASVMDDHWELILEENPVFAARLGREDGLGRLSDPSIEAYEEGVNQRRLLLTRLNAVDTPALSQDELLNHTLLTLELEEAQEEAQYGGKFLTLSTFDAPHSDLARLAEETALRTEEDYRSYVDRLAAMPDYIGKAIARLQGGIDAGWTQPCEAMTGFPRTYQTHIVDDAATSVFMLPFARQGAVDDDTHAAFAAQAEVLIRDQVVPAFETFGLFYEGQYVPNCRQVVGVSSAPNGAAYYEQRVRSFTTTDMTADEVHNVGLAEVARIRAEMEEVAAEAGFATLPEFQEHLRSTPSFYPATAEERVAVASTIAKKMDGELVKLFTVLPRMPYTILPIPLDIAEGTTTAYYTRPAVDGSRAGVYWLNTTLLETRPLYELEALTLHEAVPGHHLQIALMQELDLPNFRRFSGGFTAFVEGWGLYSERLGLEVGFYETPEDNFGRLSYEMWRACRLVVDTGLHAKGWSRQRAINFMLDNTGLSENNITREVDRYITWPGQAVAYKIGELKIRELRKRAEDALGTDFDVRLFHDVVLGSGSIPLSVLENHVDAFIEEQMATGAAE
ncbi:MAG: DUF885 domain-containing protein [Pseudomonadota bacterium]